MMNADLPAFRQPDGGSSKRTRDQARASRKESYRAPREGPNFNQRLLADLQLRFSGDIRSQISLFCKHGEFPLDQADPAKTKPVRFETGDVLQDCVSVSRSCGISLQNLRQLSPKNASIVARAWRQRGEAVGTLNWRLLILRRYFRMIGRPAPLLNANALDL